MNLAAILRQFSRVSKAIAVALAVAACVFITSSTKAGALTQTVSVPASSGDTEIRSAKAITNYGSATTVTVNGNEPAGTGNDVYGLVTFPLTNVPAGVTVADVRLRLNITNSSTQPYSAFSLKRAWVENQTTWRSWKAGTKWQTAGATGTDDRESTALFTITPNATGVQTYTLEAAARAKVQAWINNPATNNGFILANSSTTDGFSFSSRETAHSPALIVTYDDGIQSDTTPPETTIASGPSEGSTVTSSDVSFAFSSSESGSSFECSLDGSAFASCSSPKSYANLSDGSHTFAVRATGAAGNADATPASRTWTVDATAPTVTAVGPADGAAGLATTSNVEATFSEAMDSSTTNGSTFTLLKQGTSQPVAAQVSYDSATKEATLDADADLDPSATYTATVKGGANGVKDPAGNLLAKDMSWSFSTVATPPADTTPPETTIDSGPSGIISSSSAAFEFSSSEAGSSFECSVDGAAYSACTSPNSYTNLSEGSHTFEVRATDGASNVDPTPAVRHYSVQLPAPDTDGDTVPDSSDNCPLVAGPASNNGCPVVNTRVNVLDHGALAADAGNDTAAFESAMAAAGANDVVYVPGGTYRISGVNIPGDTTVEIQDTATIKKFGTANAPLFTMQGIANTSFVENIHVRGVDGDFKMDVVDAGSNTTPIRLRSVKNASIKHVEFYNNNTENDAVAPSTLKPDISFLPVDTTPLNGEYEHPHNVVIEDAHAYDAAFGWGLVQITGGEDIHFQDVSSVGGSTLRFENYENNATTVDDITADEVTCTDGHNPVMFNPHNADNGNVNVTDVYSNGCYRGVRFGDDPAFPNGNFDATTVDRVTVVAGSNAQVRDTSGPNVGSWKTGPSESCVYADANLVYAASISITNINCGGLPYINWPQP